MGVRHWENSVAVKRIFVCTFLIWQQKVLPCHGRSLEMSAPSAATLEMYIQPDSLSTIATEF